MNKSLSRVLALTLILILLSACAGQDINEQRAADRLATIEWIRDGVDPLEEEAVDILHELAQTSFSVFDRLVDGNLHWEPEQAFTYIDALSEIVTISANDEDVALRIIEMPFWDSIEFIDLAALNRLSNLSKTNGEILRHIIDHPVFEEGITDELVVYVLILHLEDTDPKLWSAIKKLAWVQDILEYPERSANGDIPVPTAPETLTLSLLSIDSELFPDFLEELTDKSWMQDDIDPSEAGVTEELFRWCYFDEQAAIHLLSMPFLATVEGTEAAVLEAMLDYAWSAGSSLQLLLDSPALGGGIPDDGDFFIDLLRLKARHPEDYERLEALPWIQDGVSASETYAVRTLTRAAMETDEVFSALMDKSWISDGLTQSESTAIHYLVGMSGSSYSQPNVELTMRIIGMPFLDTFEPVDAKAVDSLSGLHWEEDGRHLQKILDHPSMRGGITDENSLIVAVLFRVIRNIPDSLEVVLNSDLVYTEERVITLPLAGETTLAVIRSAPGTMSTMNILEDIVRHQEGFINVAFPSDVVIVVDLGFRRGGGGPTGIISVREGDHENKEHIATLAGFTYWPFSPLWIRGGGAKLMAATATNGVNMLPASPVDTDCVLADSLAELDKMSYSGRDDVDQQALQDCSYNMGLNLLVDLYDRLGDEEFRRGFADLYLSMRDEEFWDECPGADKGLCYIRKAFVENAPLGLTGVAREVIDQWYFGAEGQEQ